MNMEYLKKIEVIQEGREKVDIIGICAAIEWTANEIEKVMDAEIQKMVKKIQIRDRIIHQMKNGD